MGPNPNTFRNLRSLDIGVWFGFWGFFGSSGGSKFEIQNFGFVPSLVLNQMVIFASKKISST